MADDKIDKQVADLIDVLDAHKTISIPEKILPDNDFYFSLYGDDYEQVIGHKVGVWEVEELLGIGGMSVVYKVSRFDEHVKQKGALKVISEQFVYSAFKDRFFKERQILTDLNHPNIVNLLDAGITKTGIPWYVMEYIEGSDINQYICDNELNQKQIIELVISVCDALSCAHQFNIVHRDVKPSNVIINKEGHVKLFDFGIAHVNESQEMNLTKTGAVIGTPGYMSPEQAKGKSHLINQSTDVFATGVMLCELLTGEKPFTGEDLTEISYATIHNEPIIKKGILAKDLIAIIYKCLHKSPQKRYLDTEALKQDLLAFNNSKVISARPITWRYRLKKLIQRHPVSSTAISALILSIILTISYVVYQFYHNQKQLLFTEQVVNNANQISSKIQQTNLLPLHEIQKSYGHVSDKANLLADRLKDNKSLAGGSAYTALGMAFLSMRNSDRAKEFFNIAENLKHESVTLSRGLGLLLSQEWRNAMEKNPDPDMIKQLQQDIYQPMMAHLNKATEDQDFSHFVLGNIAYLKDDYEVAIREFNLAYQQNPGFYDALRMKSEVELLKWQKEVRQSGYVSTLPVLQVSNKTLEQAIEIGRSDPWNYVSLCTNKSAEIQVLAMANKTEELSKQLTPASQICKDALLLDPKSKSPWINRSTILLSGLGLSAQNDAKSALYQEVIDWIDKAVSQHPTDERLLLSQIRPLMGLANIAIEQDLNPSAFFERALTKLQLVEKINNQDSSRRMYNELARVHYSQGQYDAQQENHDSAITNHLMAIEAYKSSLAIQTQNSIIFNLATVESELHDLYSTTGQLAKAHQALHSSIQHRLPIITDNIDSYYAQSLVILASMIKFSMAYNDSDLHDEAIINNFMSSFKLACDYTGKSSAQLKTLNQLHEQWLKMYPETILTSCPINP